MDPDSCLESIETIKKQLDEVALLFNSARGEDKKQLEQVRCDLINILEQTVEQLERENVPNLQSSNSPHSTNIDEEFELFKAEIDKVTAENDDKNPEGENVYENSAGESDSLINELLSLEGTEVRAPFTERWGGHSYHNAVILSIVHSNEDSLLQSPKAIVLYSQPTSNAMVPCKYFLEDKCKFNQEKCKYSHGNEVDISSLKDYIVPDMKSIKKGSSIISKHDGDLWHRGEVDDELEGRSLFSVKCDVCKSVLEVDLRDMLPIIETESIKVSPNNNPIPTQLATEDDDSNEAPVILLNVKSDFGEWEKHTKGIGSKLMAKMGYIMGTGLGCRGDGRMDPVTTLVYPQGVSLDRCMELRTASEGRCLLDVEKHLQKSQKKFEAQVKRQEESILKANVFDLINNKLSKKSGESSGSNRKLDVSKSSLQKHTVKDLNRQNMQIGTYIQSMTGEIRKLEESRKRHVNDRQMLEAIDRKLIEKKSKLGSLNAAEQAVRKEQTSRKDSKKICIF